MTPRLLRILSVLSIGGLLFFDSCAKKKAIEIGEFKSYQDPAYGFGISYPKDWVEDPEVGKRIRIYSSFDARDRFLDPASSKQAGVSIEVGIDTTRGQTLDSYMKRVSEQLAEVSLVRPEAETLLGGVPASKFSFAMKIDDRNEIRGYRVAAMKDNVVTYAEVAGFNELLDDYKAIFDTALTTVRFGRLMTAAAKEDISKPSDTYETYSGKFFDIAYPTNFEYKFPQKPNTDLVMELKGYREDCTVRIEVSDAKNVDADKAAVQNEANLQKAGWRIRGKQSATIDGNTAALINVSFARGDVDGRAYYTVKGNKLYYIFLTWYRPQSGVYVPTFEKIVSSLKIKS